MPGWRPQPPAGCLNRFGSMVGRSALPMAGLNGSEKETRSSPISFIVLMASPSSWRLSAVSLSSAGMKPKGFDSDRGSRSRARRYSRPPAAGHDAGSSSRMDVAGYRERKPLISPPMAQCQQIILYGILFPVKWAM